MSKTIVASQGRPVFHFRSTSMNSTFLPPGAMLGDATLDAMHGLVFDSLARTLALPAEQFPAAYDDVVKGMEADFRREEELMETFECPDAKLHRAQHARMLAGLHHAASALMRGDGLPARHALHALADWLPFHIATLDRHLLRVMREHEQAEGVPAA